MIPSERNTLFFLTNNVSLIVIHCFKNIASVANALYWRITVGFKIVVKNVVYVVGPYIWIHRNRPESFWLFLQDFIRPAGLCSKIGLFYNSCILWKMDPKITFWIKQKLSDKVYCFSELQTMYCGLGSGIKTIKSNHPILWVDDTAFFKKMNIFIFDLILNWINFRPDST